MGFFGGVIYCLTMFPLEASEPRQVCSALLEVALGQTKATQTCDGLMFACDFSKWTTAFFGYNNSLGGKQQTLEEDE